MRIKKESEVNNDKSYYFIFCANNSFDYF